MRRRGGSEQPAKGRPAVKPKARTIPAPSVTDLQKQVGLLSRELQEARDQQTATSEVLQIISSSPGDLACVFDNILANATRLCGANFGQMNLYEDGSFRPVAHHNIPAAYAASLASTPFKPHPQSGLGTVARTRQVIHTEDIRTLTPYLEGDPSVVKIADLAGARTYFVVPMLKENDLIGAITIYRQEVKPFTEKQIELVANFAKQAVIAIENGRLFDEAQAKTRDLEEAMVHLTGSANILSVIASSPTDIAPVLQAIARSACEFCDAADAAVLLKEDDQLRFRAHHGSIPLTMYARPINRDWVNGRAVIDKVPVHVHDFLSAEGDDFPQGREMAARRMVRTILSVPLLHEGEAIGTIALRRMEAHPFSDKQIALLRTFADQAAIAIQNVKLFDEVQARTRDLEEALQQQTATADVLKVISRSAFDLQTVLNALLASACRLCEAEIGTIRYQEGGDYRLAATFGCKPEWIDHLSHYPARPDRGSIFGRTIVDGQTVHFPDVLADPDFRRQRAQNLMGFRAALGVPLVRDGQTFGVISLLRLAVGPFSEKQIELIQTFADQAVIAIENVRLITETREALERQTATAEVLQAINSSPGDLAPVFQAMLEKAHSLCGISHGSLQLYDGEKFRAVAVHGISEAFANRLRQGFLPGPNHPSQPLLKGARFAQTADCAEADDPLVRAAFELAGFRTVLFIPLRKDGSLLGQIAAARQEVRPFTEKEIALLENFAAQAVIAMENARLLTEQREALERQTATAEVLQAINSSPGDLAPVFEMILEKAHSLCAVALGTLLLYDGGKFRAVAVRGFPEMFAARLRQGFVPGPNLPHRRLLEGARFAQVADWAEIDDPLARASVDAGVRTSLFIPLRREGALLGYIAASRAEVRPFTEKEIAILESFAAQAVIAMENARLLGELRGRTADLARSVDELTATSDVLKIISRSTVDLETVLDTLVETVARLCRTDQTLMFRRRDDKYHLVAARGLSEEAKVFIDTHPLTLDRGTVSGRVALERRAVHIPDILQDPEYSYAGAKVTGVRTILGVPLLREETLVGIFTVHRTRLDPFTDKEIELVTTFADQAVIAIENARLFEELRQRQAELARSVDELTATGDVLKIISRSTVDLATVLDTLVETAARLCHSDQARMYRRQGDHYYSIASHGFSPENEEWLSRNPIPKAGRGTAIARAAAERCTVHIADVLADPEYTWEEGQRLTGYRTVLAVPLLRGETLIGLFSLLRARVAPFTEKEIELVTTFADQAVIAIENARLFEELRQSLQQQMATADVLKVISRSAFDLGSVLQTLVESAARLCDADKANITRQTGDVFYRAEFCGFSDEFMDHLRRIPIKPERGSASGRALLERRAVHILDVLSDPEYTLAEEANWGGFRTALAVPILREGVPLGVLNLTRSEMRPFTDKQIELVSTFADQAAIAIENARLVAELRERQAELRVTFDNMGDGVVMFGADTRLVAWNRNFEQILDLPETFLTQRPSYAEFFRYLANRGEYSTDLEAELSRRLHETDRESRLERIRPDGRVIEVRRNPVPGGGFVLIYADITKRKRAEEAIRAARDAAEAALRDLQAAQASLVHAQKMAALGQVTAGIAHEIKNPLNFVNNFAGLSVELLDELKEAAALSTGTLDPAKRAEILETIRTVTGNLEKIVEHGRRADGIVRSMLQHSRGGSGDWQATDLNALVEEALNLAYHGARAQDQSFEIALERDLDRDLGQVDVVPQEITRVLLNLISNGFYAVAKRGSEGNGAFCPTLQIATRELGEDVEVRVRDNGVGIPAEDYDKLFQPFFTTKPTGEGTGLGLSISYEIITLQHGGSIRVESEVGDFTEFTVRLPRRRHAVAR